MQTLSNLFGKTLSFFLVISEVSGKLLQYLVGKLLDSSPFFCELSFLLARFITFILLSGSSICLLTSLYLTSKNHYIFASSFLYDVFIEFISLDHTKSLITVFIGTLAATVYIFNFEINKESLKLKIKEMREKKKSKLS